MDPIFYKSLFELLGTLVLVLLGDGVCAGVSLNKTSLTLDKGKMITLSATVKPSNATDKTVTWTSYDSSIATVTSAGVVKGIAPGTTTIRAKTKDGGYTADRKSVV